MKTWETGTETLDGGQEFAKRDRPRNASYSRKEEREHNDQIFGIFANHTFALFNVHEDHQGYGKVREFSHRSLWSNAYQDRTNLEL